MMRGMIRTAIGPSTVPVIGNLWPGTGVAGEIVEPPSKRDWHGV